MVELPDDIYSDIAQFLSPIDLKRFHIANKTINCNPLIKKHIFRLRLARSINCRNFLPTQLAKEKQEEFLKYMKSNNYTNNYRYLLSHKGNYLTSVRVHFSDVIEYVRYSFHSSKHNIDPDSFKKKVRELYPYTNINKKMISCSHTTATTLVIEVIYDLVPEKYITIEQVEHDIFTYYNVLKKHQLI